MIPLNNQHSSDALIDEQSIAWTANTLKTLVRRFAGAPYATAYILAGYAARWSAIPRTGVKLSTFMDMVHTTRIGLQFQGDVRMNSRMVDDECLLSASSWYIQPMNATWRYNYIMNQSAYLDAVAQMVIQQLNIFPPVEILTYDSLAAGAQEQEPWHTPESALKASKFIADNKLLDLDREKVRKYLDGEWDAGDYAKLREDK